MSRNRRAHVEGTDDRGTARERGRHPTAPGGARRTSGPDAGPWQRAADTREQVGEHVYGRMGFQPLYEEIVRADPDILR
jgi:hypothetical protein